MAAGIQAEVTPGWGADNTPADLLRKRGRGGPGAPRFAPVADRGDKGWQ